MQRKNQSGQILLITLLALSVATTIALALVGRATTDVNVSNQLDEGAKAFNAAEAGLEQSLKTGLATNGQQTITAGVHYEVTKTDIGGGAGNYVLPGKTTKGNTATIWLAAHDDTTGALIETPVYGGNTITLCWQDSAALIVAVLYKQAGVTYQVVRGAYDPNPARSSNNQFDGNTDKPGCGDGTTNVKKTIDLAALGISQGAGDVLLALRVRPLYSDSQLVVKPEGSVLPKQGNNYESSGTTDTGLARKVFVNQLYRSPDTVFDYVVYSQAGNFGHTSTGF